MIYLLLAIGCSSLISIFMRLSEKYRYNQMAMFMTNYIICTCLSYLFMEEKTLTFSLSTFFIGLISGLLYLVSLVYLNKNMKENGIVMSATFSKLGILIPTLMAIFIFRETPGLNQILGIGIALIAIILINYEKEESTIHYKKSWLILLLVLSGLTDSMANIFDKLGNPLEKDLYLLLNFFFAFLFSFIVLMKEKKKITRNDILFGALIGIPNYLSSRFLLLALGSMEAVLVYPLSCVSTIIIITLSGILFFKEKISNQKKLALGLILVAMVLMNL